MITVKSLNPLFNVPPPPSNDGAARDTVVSFFNEYDLARALAPAEQLALRQRWVKTRLIVTDFLVLWACLLVGRLPLLLRDDMSLLQSANLWWAGQGQLRVALFGLMTLVMVGWMGAAQGHYTASRRKPWWNETLDVMRVVVVVGMLDAMLMYFGKWDLSRLWTGASWALVLVALPLARLFVRRKLLKAGLLAQPYVLIGRPDDVELAAAALASEPLMGYTPVAVICPEPGARLVRLGQTTVAPGTLTESVKAFLAKPGSYQIVTVLGNENNGWLRQITQKLMLTRDDLVIIPPLGGMPLYGMETSHFYSHDVLMLRARNNLNRKAPQAVKRALDIVGSSVILVLLSPLFAYFAWKVSRDGGAAFFGHVRVGQKNRPFKCYKFRSMVVNAQEELQKLLASDPAAKAEWERDFKLKNDPRVSRIGAFLRRTSLDELPQLWNVLKGEMSLVGPRPLIRDELCRYGDDVAYYLEAKPGMTGLWQVSGRSDISYASRVHFDAWYVRNWSLWFDWIILMRTVRVVLKQEGAV